MRLTSSVKELEAILQKLIKSEPVLVNINDNEKHEMASLAMRMPSDLRSSGLGSVQRRNETKRKLFFHKNWKK
jgi:hypothetical protein